MGILSKIKSVLGLDGSGGRSERGTSVTVEREPETSTERAVKEGGPSAGAEEAEAEPEVEEAVESDAEPEEAEIEEAEPVESIKGIGPAYAERLSEAGIETVADLAAADAEEVAGATDIAAGRVETWIERARER